MSFKNRTPQEKINKANKKIDKAIKKRDKLDINEKYSPFYEEKRKKLNRTIARAIEDKEIAREEIKHPAPVPKYLDNSKYINISPEVNLGNNKNSATANFTAQFNKKDTKGKSKRGNKKSKVKFYFYLIVAIIVLAGVIALTVHITNCVNDNKDTSSTFQQTTSI